MATSLVTYNHHIEDLLVIFLEFGLRIFMAVDRPSTTVDELILRDAGDTTDLESKSGLGLRRCLVVTVTV